MKVQPPLTEESHLSLTPHAQAQCRIFSTTFNPERLRLGNKILRQRLKGPTVAAYYPRKMGTLKELQQAYPDFEVIDEKEEDRFEKIRVYVVSLCGQRIVIVCVGDVNGDVANVLLL